MTVHFYSTGATIPVGFQHTARPGLTVYSNQFVPISRTHMRQQKVQMDIQCETKEGFFQWCYSV